MTKYGAVSLVLTSVGAFKSLISNMLACLVLCLTEINTYFKHGMDVASIAMFQVRSGG